tara:strand:+ start:447 stop:839 length:393 start_codon:yes stop_codon:yes gene_type:complete
MIEGKPNRSLLGNIFKWWFVIFNILMVVWIGSAINTTDEAIQDSEDEYEEAGAAVGGTIATGFICGIWFIGAVIFGMLAMVTKPSGTVITTTVPQTVAEDSTAKLTEAKKLLDSGVITQEEFDEMKKKYL